MLDTAAYRVNETNARRAIADWRISNINDPYIFQNQGFPVRVDSFLDLAQILDTMQEDRFDYYMKELGGFTDEDLNFFIATCLDYVDFYHSVFQRERVVLPLSTLIAHFVIYKKLCGYQPQFSRLLEIGPGCGYLSFFLRDHRSLLDYSQIESTESFYLLQSHINSHVFGASFDEHALSKYALNDHGVYHPKLKWHDQFHYEEQKIINLCKNTVCNHFPWWRIGEVANRKYEIVSSNANLNEFSREALFQYLSLIRDVLVDDGVIIAQCLGGGAPTYETVFSNMKSAGFVPVALVWVDNVPGRIFVVSNGVFVGERHPLYSKYAGQKPAFPTLDRELGFVNKMYFMNEESSERKKVYTIAEISSKILDRYKEKVSEQVRSNFMLPPTKAGLAKGAIGSSFGSPSEKATKAGAQIPDLSRSSGHLKEIGRLERVARLVANGDALSKPIGSPANKMQNSTLTPDADAEVLRCTIRYMRSSKSWRLTAPLRRIVTFVRNPIRGFRPATEPPVDTITDMQALKREIELLQSSTSWRITGPFRLAMQFITRR